MGYCDNPKSYYFGTEVDLGFKEECGRSCRCCPYYYDPERDPVVQTAEYLLSSLKSIQKEIEIVDQQIEALKKTDDPILKFLIEELKKKKAKLLKQLNEVEEAIREHRRDVERQERLFPFY